jgi:nucleoside-diphosphate-sugar epimerase
VLILRCGNVYGEGQRGDRSQGVVAAGLASVETGQPFRVFGDVFSERDSSTSATWSTSYANCSLAPAYPAS